MGAACASVMTLDKHWKPYMETLPQPNQLARVYGASELESLIRDVETFLQHANPMMPTGTIKNVTFSIFPSPCTSRTMLWLRYPLEPAEI